MGTELSRWRVSAVHTVLIIDDDAAVRTALANLLGASGYAVTEAAHGRAGLQFLEQVEVDLLLLDLDLPEVSGWDILDIVAVRRPLMPVLVLTGQHRECVPGSLAGVDAFLVKPPDVGELLEKVSGLLSEPLEARLERRRRTPLWTTTLLTRATPGAAPF